jgi:restriction system protein
MPIPDFQSFMRPVLAFASDGSEKDIAGALEAIAAVFQLTPEDRAVLLPSGKQTTVRNRLQWACTFLDKAGAVERTRRGHFRITPRGMTLLEQYPQRIDNRVLKQFPEFVAFQTSRSEEQTDVVLAPAPGAAETLSTPEETISVAEGAIGAALKSQLLERIREMSPAFFEGLVVDLIVAMGYGGTRASVARRLGHSGDEGIDGVVNEDPLGLDVVYIQAKRYAPDNTIGRERIQQFAGALVGQGASKGVFVTTSSFSKGAAEYAQKVPQRIILLDGGELARLMVQYGVGVRTERTIEIKRIDADYFGEVD